MLCFSLDWRARSSAWTETTVSYLDRIKLQFQYALGKGRGAEGPGRKVWRIAFQLAAGSSHNGIGGHCMRAVAACSNWLNWIIERICALLVAAMVVVVWVGTLSRYGISFDTSWAEELARYIMIWAALLAIPCGAYYREHIGLELLLQQLPGRVQRVLRVALDLCGLCCLRL